MGYVAVCRTRGFAAIVQAYVPSVPIDFVTFVLGLDNTQEVRRFARARIGCRTVMSAQMRCQPSGPS